MRCVSNGPIRTGIEDAPVAEILLVAVSYSDFTPFGIGTYSPLIATGPLILASQAVGSPGPTWPLTLTKFSPVTWKQSAGPPRLFTSRIPNPNDFTQSAVLGCSPAAGFSQSNVPSARVFI